MLLESHTYPRMRDRGQIVSVTPIVSQLLVDKVRVVLDCRADGMASPIACPIDLIFCYWIGYSDQLFDSWVVGCSCRG